MADWPAGTYVLTVDRWDQPVYEGEGAVRMIVDNNRYVKGDEVELNERDARRLGESGSIAAEDSSAAKAARGLIDPMALQATSQLSLEEKRARIAALEAQIEEEEAEVERLEDEGAEAYPIPVAGHPGTAVAQGDPDNQEDATRSAAVRRKGNRASGDAPQGSTAKADAKSKGAKQ